MKRSFIFITLIILIALETPAPAQQRNPADSARRARAITGRVVNESGQPIPNAAIHLGLVGSNRFLGRPLVTDEEGRFSADELVTGSYYMHVNVPGYVQADNPTPHTYYRVGDSITIRMTKGGVITGSVTNSAGEPVVAVSVRAVFVRDLEGGPGRGFTFFNDMPTDDRGVYRLYGLRPGVYHVLATGQDLGFITGSSPYDNDAPTYYPASTRDTAAEVIVRAGDEASGIDIRYRGERGHAISGTETSSIKVAASSPSGITINLLHAQTGALEATAFISNGQKNNRFAFYGVPDGKYELTATHITNAENFSASPTRRVTVKGSDVTGVELALTPLGSIAGRVVLEPLQRPSAKPSASRSGPRRCKKLSWPYAAMGVKKGEYGLPFLGGPSRARRARQASSKFTL